MANNKLRVKGVNTGGGGGGTEFISVWDTTLGDGSNVIVLPFIPEGTYNCTINWGDGSLSDSADSGKGFSQPSHTYETPGTYTITITGTVEGWSFGYDPNAGPFPPENPIPNSQEKLTSITNVGPLKLVDYGSYFVGCSNLTTIGGTFDLTGITTLGGMFANCTSLTSVNGIGSWNTSAVTDMNSMFNNATLFNGNISGWNVSSVTDMSSMFYDATAFNQNISGWNTAAVTDMGSMFAGASSFNQPLNSWDVSSVTNMSSMFYDATAFNQNISGWNVSSVTSMNSMFAGASSFNQPLNSWDVSSVTDMSSMFGATKQGTSIFNQPLNSWNVSAVTNMTSMFAYATFNQDISGWDVSSVTDMNGMFEHSTVFNQPLNSWNVSSVTNMSYMFANATAFNQDISGWDISNVADMGAFMLGKSTADYSYYDNLLNAWSALTLQNGVYWGMGSIEYTSAGATARQSIIDNYSWTIEDGGEAVPPQFISVWDTTLGDGNFDEIILPLVDSGNYNFTVNWGDGNTDTITAWDQAEKTHTYATGGTYTVTITGTIEGWSFGLEATSNGKLTSITDIGCLKLGNTGAYFAGCYNLTTIGGTFDLSGTTILSSMFSNCTSLTSVNGIEYWNTSAVTEMVSVFAGASLFNQDISGWDTSAVTSMRGMFDSATAFNQNISGWDTSSVTNMSYMFSGAILFNVNISGWNVSAVTDMSYMFDSATAFNQNISTWDISNVADMEAFMNSKSTANYSYYDNLLNAWSQLTLQTGVTWGMGTIEYTTAGQVARGIIITPSKQGGPGWFITDGGTP